MDSRESNMAQNHPTLCKNNCGFYSNSGNEGLCSVCYKDIVKKKQAPPTNMPASFSKWQIVNVNPFWTALMGVLGVISLISQKIINLQSNSISLV